MSEIRIIIDTGAEAKTLSDVVAELTQVRDLSNQIKGNKQKLVEAKGAEEVTALTAEIERLRAQMEKLTQERVKQKQGTDAMTKALEKLHNAQSEEAKELALINEQIKQHNTANRDTAKLTLNNKGIVQKLRNELKEVTKQWTETTNAQQLDINVTGSLARRKAELTAQLGKLEQATGDHRRSVGHYEKGLKGLDLILGVVEKKFGIQLDYMRSILDATSKLTKGGGSLTKIFNTTNNTTQTLNTSTQTLNTTINQTVSSTATATGGFKAFTESILASGKALLSNPFSIALVAITALAAGIYGLIENAREQRKAFYDAKESIDDWAASTKDTIADVNKLKIELAAERGVIKEHEAERKKLVIDRNKELEDLNKDARDRAKKIKDKEDEGYIESDERRGRILSALQIEYNEKRRLIFEKYNIQYKKVLSDASMEAAEALSARFDILAKIEDEKQKEAINKQKERDRKELERINGLRDNFQKFISYRIEAVKGEWGEVEQAQAKLDIETKITLGIVTPEELKAYNDQITKEKKDAQKEQDDLWKEAMAEADRLSKIDVDKKLENDKKQKEALEKRLKEEADMRERFADAAFEGMEERNQKELQQNADKITELDSQLAYQRELALKGEKNSLQEVEKARADALAEKAQLEKQAANQARGQKAAEIFLDFYKAYASEKEGAFGKALAATAKGKGGEALVRTLFAGSFYDGTEDTGNGGNIDSRGGMIGILHPKERILTREQNEPLLQAGISNDELVKNALLYNDMFGNTGVIADRSKEIQVNEALTKLLVSELKGVRSDLKAITDVDFKRNTINEIITIEKRLGGITETTNKKIGTSFRRD